MPALSVRLMKPERPGDRMTLDELRPAFKPGDATMVKETTPVSKILGKPLLGVALIVAEATVLAGTGPREDGVPESWTFGWGGKFENLAVSTISGRATDPLSNPTQMLDPKTLLLPEQLVWKPMGVEDVRMALVMLYVISNSNPAVGEGDAVKENAATETVLKLSAELQPLPKS